MPDSDSNTIWESYLNEQFPPESPAIESDVEEQIQKISAITIEQAKQQQVFWGYIVQKMLQDVIIHDGQYGDTMAVDESGTLLLNRQFCKRLLQSDPSGELVRGVFFHEAQHIMSKSFPRFDKLMGIKDLGLWNVATDYVMNRDLLNFGITLPEFGLLPRNENGRHIISFDADHVGSLQGKYSGTVELDITGLKAEDVYYEIRDKLQAANMPDQPPKPEAGEGEGQGEGEGEGEGEG